jgi:hypothetical protein
MNTAGGKVVRLPLIQLPVHLKRRSTSLATRLVGLDTIAAACRVTPDVLLRWRDEAGFPLVWKGGKWKGQWTTTSKAIEGWLMRPPWAEADAKHAQ